MHHIVTSDEEVHVYLGDRRDGIDSTLPLDRCEIHRSERGHETFGADVAASAGDRSGSSEDGNSDPHADSEKELVTDGGYVGKSLDIIEQSGVETGDIVRYDGRRWMVEGYDEWHFVVIVPEGLVPGRHLDDGVYEVTDVRNVERVDDASDNVDVQAGDVVTVRDEDRRSDPGPWKVEDIQCGEATLWSSMQPMRYEPVEDLALIEKAEDTGLPHSVPDQDDGDGDPELVTDGGTRIESGDVVSHDGEQYRVGRTGETFVELYRRGEASVVERVSDVEIVPGAVAVRGGDR